VCGRQKTREEKSRRTQRRTREKKKKKKKFLSSLPGRTPLFEEQTPYGD
jgi:hypothetical protein